MNDDCIFPPEILGLIFRHIPIKKIIELFENKIIKDEKILRDKFLTFNLNDLARLHKQIRKYKYTDIYVKNIHNSLCLNKKLLITNENYYYYNMYCLFNYDYEDIIHEFENFACERIFGKKYNIKKCYCYYFNERLHRYKYNLPILKYLIKNDLFDMNTFIENSFYYCHNKIQLFKLLIKNPLIKYPFIKKLFDEYIFHCGEDKLTILKWVYFNYNEFFNQSLFRLLTYNHRLPQYCLIETYKPRFKLPERSARMYDFLIFHQILAFKSLTFPHKVLYNILKHLDFEKLLQLYEYNTNIIYSKTAVLNYQLYNKIYNLTSLYKTQTYINYVYSIFN